MKILHLEAEFIPKTGYQVNLLSKYMVMYGSDVTILSTDLKVVRQHQLPLLKNYNDYSDFDFHQKYGVNIIRVPCWGIISDRHVWSLSVFRKIKDINPDILFLHDNDTLISILYILFFLKKFQIPLITDSHMVSLASKNRFSKLFQFTYRKLITPILIANNIKVVRTVNDLFVQNVFCIPENLSPIISFGSDIQLFKPNSKRRNELRIKLNIPLDNRVFIYSGKLSEDKKGLFLSNALKTEFKYKEGNKESTFIIISDVFGKYGDKVELGFAHSENNIIRIPFVTYEELADILKIADVAIIHYAASLTYFDYLASGLPVIWSDIEVNRNRSDERFVRLFKNLDLTSFRDVIQQFINMSNEDLSVMSNIARKYILSNYSYNSITQKFLKIMVDEITYRETHPFK